MTHERFVRMTLALILIALVANLFKPQIQGMLSPPVAAQEQGKALGGELRVPGNLIVDGSIITKGEIRIEKGLTAKGAVQAAQIKASQIEGDSLSLQDKLTVANAIQCRDLSVEKLLSAQNAQIAQALSATNVAVSQDLLVTGKAVIENIAVHEIKALNDELDKSQSRIIDEIVARTIVVLRAIEKP